MTRPVPTLRQRIARRLLALRGWQVDDHVPEDPKYVLIVAPHTSNWDFPLGYLGKTTLGLHLHWVGKHTLFRWPIGWLSRRLGGIAVDRRSRNNVIQQLAAVFAKRERLVIAITPEGTRSYTPGWKSGFYYTALEAKVPIAMAYIDYSRKRMGIGELFRPCGDIHADMDRIRAFYSDKVGCHPENAGEIRILPPKAGSEAAANRASAPQPGPLNRPRAVRP
jgi:1-acyl-sn-glycerol-3-phosphate acyltransferase